MTLILFILLSIPILWLLALLYYLFTWFDWDKRHAYVPK
jgi:hypothetical protein